MEKFIQQVATGLSTGSLYAILALALVLIYRSTGIVNFAQGEMAMFTTFIAWSFLDFGMHLVGVRLDAGIAGIFGALTNSSYGRSRTPHQRYIVTLGYSVLSSLAYVSGKSRRVDTASVRGCATGAWAGDN
jgi:branched-subunit amino acid ABC-type transport system permease component